MTAEASAAAVACADRPIAGPTLEEIETWPATVAVPRAAEALGISQSWAYQLIAQGEFPCRVLKLGSRSRGRVVTASLISLLTTGEA